MTHTGPPSGRIRDYRAARQLTSTALGLRRPTRAGERQRTRFARQRGLDTGDLEALEKEFVSAAKPYGERKGISDAAWRGAPLCRRLFHHQQRVQASTGTALEFGSRLR